MFVLDRTLNTSHILSANKNSQSAFWEDTYTQEFDTGAESFEFSCYAHESIKEGNYVAFFYNNQYKMFQIIEVQEVHKKGKLVSECYCETASLQLLNNYVKPFSGDMNCIQFFQHILHGTEWHIGKYSTSLENVVYTVNEKNIESVWSLIEDYKDIYGCEINVRVTYDNGHVTGQYIDIYAEGGLGSSTLKRFEYGRNVTGIILDVECDVSNTVIQERDGYGFTKGAGDVILDDNANRMYNAGRTHVIGVYQGNETEPVEACINAWKELQKRKEPKFDYKVTTALKDDEYEDIHLGDTVYVVDHSYTPPLLLEARVGKLELSFTDRTQNSCTLTNYKEIKSKLLDADYIKLTGTITDVVNAFFPITSEGIADGAIVDGKIETTYFQQITADIVSAGIGAFEELYTQGLTVINADIENLNADKASIIDLQAVQANIATLNAATANISNALINKASIEDLNAVRADIENLHADKADIDDLNAIHADIEVLEADVAEIDTLVNGHLTSDNIQSLVLTADKVTVDDAFIKNAMIDSINADKITTGTLDTSKVNISSADGSMTLNGSLQQFKDASGKVRIQLGKDAQGNFTFALFSQDGQGVLIDETGIKEGAIGDGLIVDDMVADNANIAGSKLDINSVITSINNGTTNINSSRIYLDEEGQSLQVAFDALKTKVETIEDVTISGDLSSVIEQVNSNTTAINMQQGQIDSLISNTTIVKANGEVVSLKDDYSSTKQTIDSHTTKIGSLETNLNDVSSKQASMELNLNGFKTEVSETYTTKTELEDFESNITDSIATSEANMNSNITSSINNAKDDLRGEMANNYVSNVDYQSFIISTESSFEQTNADITMKFENTTSLVQSVNNNLQNFQNTVETNIRFSEDGVDIGKNDSPFAVNISNEKMSFTENSKEVAYISNSEMKITDAIIKNSLTLGGFKFIPRTTGNVSLVWHDGGNLIRPIDTYCNKVNNWYPTHVANFAIRPTPGQMYTFEICGSLRASSSCWAVYNTGGMECCVQIPNEHSRNGVWVKSAVWTNEQGTDNTQAHIYAMPNSTESNSLSYIKIIPGDDYWKSRSNLLSYNNVYTENCKYGFYSQHDDHYALTEVYGYFDAGTTYKFATKTNGTWWRDGDDEYSDTVQAWLVGRVSHSLSATTEYILMNTNENGEALFTPTVGGRYWLRLDINQAGHEYFFWDFKVVKATTENTQTATVIVEGDEE